MIDSITRITLNLQETNTMVSIRAKRGDTGRKLLIHLSDGSIPYHISDDCYATFTAKKPDGTKINNACTIENNVIEYEFTDQTCTAVGTMKAEIRLYGADDKMITSACFLVNVYDTVFRDGDEVGSETEMNTLDDLILRANAFLNETGKLLRWQGNWDSETEYEANDLVLHEEVLYVAEEAIPAGTAPGSEEVTAWVPIAGMGGGNVDLTGYAKTEDIPKRPEDIGAQPSGNYALKSEIPQVPVQSVNGKTGAVQLSASDVKARPENWTPSAQEVGALPDTYTPPNQTAEQVGADPKGTAASTVSQHNTSDDSHNDIRLELKAINDRLTAFFDSDNQTLDELSEIVAYITSNKSLIDSITTSKVSVVDIINNLTTNVSNKPLSAAQGVVLKGLIDAVSKSLSNYLESSELPTAINTALAQAKASGEFDGRDGASIMTTTGSDFRYETGYGYEILISQIETLDGLLNLAIGSLIYAPAENNIYIVKSLDGSFAFMELLASIKGENGYPPYIQDGYWYAYNDALGDYRNTDVKAQGKDGTNPVRGTDYWTDDDKLEIKSYVDEAILGGEW